MSALAALICGYLDGDDTTLEVLNDALEELGRERSASKGPASFRLQVTLERILPDTLVEHIVLDFAEHVANSRESNEVHSVLDAKRRWIADSVGDARPFPANLLNSLHNLGWSDDNTPESSAAWAVWSALIAPPRYVAAAAQRVRSNELSWQIAHVKNVVMWRL